MWQKSPVYNQTRSGPQFNTYCVPHDPDSAKINSSELVLAVHPDSAGTGQIFGAFQCDGLRSLPHETILKAYKHNMHAGENYS